MKIKLDSIKFKEEQKKASVNSKLASIGLLSSGIGHEINNPLSVVLMSNSIIAALMKKKDILDNDIAQRLDVQLKSINRIKKIVEGLRKFARQSDVEVESIDLRASIESTSSLLKELFAKQNVLVEVDSFSEELYTMGNRGELEQVFVNLMTNARDAILEKETPEGTVKVKTRFDQKNIFLDFIDNGRGIEKENLTKIFDNFFTTKDVNKGTGMGLSIANSIIESMHGEMSVSSKVGEGTTFTLKLKRSKKPKVTSFVEESAASEQLDLEKMSAHVVVVEDETGLLESFRFVLESFGLTVETATNGREGLEKITSEPEKYDAIFTDLKMPVMNGEEMIKKVKESKIMTPIIVVTGGIESEFSQEFKELEKKVFCIVRKPYSAKEIHSILKKLLDQKSSRVVA